MIRHEKPTLGELRRSGRVFAFTLAAGFAFVAAVAYWRGLAAVQIGAEVLAVIALLAGALAPARLEPLRKAWMRLGEAIGRVTTPLLMAVVYYLILTPTGLVRRALAARAPAQNTAWHQRAPLPPKERMERQF